MLRAEGADGGALTTEIAALQREVDALLLEEKRARARARSHCRCVPPPIHSIPYVLMYSVPLSLNATQPQAQPAPSARRAETSDEESEGGSEAASIEFDVPITQDWARLTACLDEGISSFYPPNFRLYGESL